MRIPDLSRMVSRVKVNETVVNRLRGDHTAPTGFLHAWDAAVALGQYSHMLAGLGVAGTHTGLPGMLPGFISQREYKSDYLHLAEEIVEYGMPASIRVPSVDRPLAGHVKMVSSVASSTDWMSSDVKVYQTMIAIDEHIDGLKPNMSSEVTVKIDERKNVLKLPVQAVLESAGKKFCYVRKGEAIEKKIVKTGLNNYKFVEIIEEGSEVKEGDVIVLNARAYAEKVNDLQGGGQDSAGNMKDRGNRKRGGAASPGGKAPPGQSPGARDGAPGKGKTADVSSNQPEADAPAKPRERRNGGARATN
jgi:hypothetical protein